MTTNTPAKRRRGRPRNSNTIDSNTTLQSLNRAIATLRSIARHGQASLSQLAEEQDIPAASMHRILSTLAQQQFVQCNEEAQLWHIGIEAFRTGSAFLTYNSLLDSARKVMRQLMQKTGETVNLATPEDGYVVFISQVESQHPIRAFFQPGTRAVMHATGSGKAILATYAPTMVQEIVQRVGLDNFTDYTLNSMESLQDDLAITRQRGWSFDGEEHFIGMSCIGAAIFNAQAEAVGGISVSGPSSRFGRERHALLGDAVTQAAKEITLAIGGQWR